VIDERVCEPGRRERRDATGGGRIERERERELITDRPSDLPVTVVCDARFTDAGPGRIHLNGCVCGRIENIAGLVSGDRGMREGKER
jgi:hypothetical protein